MMQLDNSGREAFASCPRKYFLSCICGLRPLQGSNALRYGSTWHAIMEGYYSAVKAGAKLSEAVQQALAYGRAIWELETQVHPEWEEDYRTLDAAGEALLAYIDEFQQTDVGSLEVKATEQSFFVEVGDNLGFFGKIDMRAVLDGIPFVVEHKTTGQSAALVAERLNRSAQIMGYTYAAKAMGLEVQGCLVVIHQVSCRRKADGTWGKQTIAFRRVPMIFTDSDLAEWQRSFTLTAEQIAECEARQCWPMQFDSCYRFGRCCYAPLCERHLSLDELQDKEAEIPGFIRTERDYLEPTLKRISNMKEAMYAKCEGC